MTTDTSTGLPDAARPPPKRRPVKQLSQRLARLAVHDIALNITNHAHLYQGKDKHS
jgi:hypothetical protein